MTTKRTSGCGGLPFFRHFCHLSCFAVEGVRDCRARFQSLVWHFVLMPVWLKANRSVCTHEVSLVCLVTKKELTETVLPIIIFLTLLSVTIQEKRKKHYRFVGLLYIIIRVLWVLVLCLHAQGPA